jgi:hypothetical protein
VACCSALCHGCAPFPHHPCVGRTADVLCPCQDGFRGTLTPGETGALATVDLSHSSSQVARDFLALLAFDFGEEEGDEGEEGSGKRATAQGWVCPRRSAASTGSHGAQRPPVPFDASVVDEWARDMVLVELHPGTASVDGGSPSKDTCSTRPPTLLPSLRPDQTAGLVIECRGAGAGHDEDEQWREVRWNDALGCYAVPVDPCEEGGDGGEVAAGGVLAPAPCLDVALEFRARHMCPDAMAGCA